MAGGFADILRSLLLSVVVSPEPRMHLWAQGWRRAWSSRVPCPAPLAQAHGGTILSSQEAWKPRQEACHPQQALQAEAVPGAPSAHLRELTAGEGGEVDHPHPENSVGACQRGCGQLGAKASGGCTKLPSFPLTGAMLFPLPWALSWASSSKAVWNQGWGPGKGE